MIAIWLVGLLCFAALIAATRLLRGPLSSNGALAFVTILTCLTLSLAAIGALTGAPGLIEAAIGLCLAQSVVALAAMKVARHRSLQIALAQPIPRNPGEAS
jgi:multisubunit Na+/H+ antiporter MnhF subunit